MATIEFAERVADAVAEGLLTESEVKQIEALQDELAATERGTAAEAELVGELSDWIDLVDDRLTLG